MSASRGLSPEALVEVFGFHVWLDAELRVVQLGRTLARVVPSLAAGQPLFDHFELVRPRCEPALEVMRRHGNEHFVLVARGSSMRLRGQMLTVEDGAVFLGWPWVTDVDELNDLGLTLTDFAIHNPMADQLWMIRSMRTTLDDTRELAARLAEQRERLLESQRRIDLHLRHTPLGVIEWDGQGRITAWNPAASRMFGIAEADAIGRDRSLLGIVAAPEEPGFASDLPLFGAAKQATVQATVLLAHELGHAGGAIACEWSNTPLVDGSGHVIGIASIVRDVTDTRRSERILREAHRLESVGLFAGGFAHDFNNLLAALLGDVDLALLKAGPNSEVAVHLEQMAATTERAAKLTKQLLHYAGRGSYQRRAVDFNKLLVEVVAVHSTSLGDHVELSLHLDRSRPWVNGDVGQLRQVIINLLVNAAEAIGERPGHIELRTAVVELDAPAADPDIKGRSLTDGSYVKLAVIDDGVGMGPDVLPRIFEPFFSTKFTGRGLGLAAILGSVRGHDGAIRVASSPDHGATFEVWFPAIAKPT